MPHRRAYWWAKQEPWVCLWWSGEFSEYILYFLVHDGSEVQSQVERDKEKGKEPILVQPFYQPGSTSYKEVSTEGARARDSK